MTIASLLDLNAAKERFRQRGRPLDPMRAVVGDGTGVVHIAGTNKIVVELFERGSQMIAQAVLGAFTVTEGQVVDVVPLEDRAPMVFRVLGRDRPTPLFGRLRFIKSTSWTSWPLSDPNTVLMSDIMMVDPVSGAVVNIGAPGWLPETTRNSKFHPSGVDPERRSGQYRSSKGKLVIVPQFASYHRSSNPQPYVNIPEAVPPDVTSYFLVFADGEWRSYPYDHTFLSNPPAGGIGPNVPLSDDHLVDTYHDDFAWWVETEVVSNANWDGQQISTAAQVFRAWIGGASGSVSIERVGTPIRTVSLSNWPGIDVTPWNDGNNGSFNFFSAGFPEQVHPSLSGQTIQNRSGPPTGYEIGAYDLLGFRPTDLGPPPHLAFPALRVITPNSGELSYRATWRSPSALYWLRSDMLFRCVGDLNSAANWASWVFSVPGIHICGGGDSFYVIVNQTISTPNQFSAVRYDGPMVPGGVSSQTIYKYTPLPDFTISAKAIWTIVPDILSPGFSAMAYQNQTLYVAFGRQVVDGTGYTESGSIWRVDSVSDTPSRVCGLPIGYLGGYVGLMADDGHAWGLP